MESQLNNEYVNCICYSFSWKLELGQINLLNTVSSSWTKIASMC